MNSLISRYLERSKSPSSRELSRLPGFLLFYIAKKRRSLGIYDKTTHICFKLATIKWPSNFISRHYREYLRDIGYDYGFKNRSRLFECPHKLEAFKAYLQSKKSILLLGNAPNVDLSENQVNSYDCVIRFNDCFGELSVGSKLDVWVCSPGYDGEQPDSYDWKVMTGPEMAWLTHASNSVGVPLSIWKLLVSTLEAPPSSGILMLTWIIELGLECDVYGIGSLSSRYHQVSAKRKASIRHDFKKEAELLAKLIN